MFPIPPSAEMHKHQGRLSMDPDGKQRTCVGIVEKAPQSIPADRDGHPRFIYTATLYEADGTTRLSNPAGKQFEAKGFITIDTSDTRFESLIFAFFPEFRGTGFSFDPANMVGRKVIVKVKYNEKREADGFPPELTVNSVAAFKPVSASGGQGPPAPGTGAPPSGALPPGVNPAAPF